MSLCECLVDPNILLLPCALIFLYLADLVISIVNTAERFQKRKSVYPSGLIAAHLAFCVIGAVVFFCASSVLWLWSSKYAFTHAERMWRLCAGLWLIFFFKDLPLLVIETQAFLLVGWRGGDLMDASFVLQVVFFVPSSLVTSATISWYAAGFLERQFGDAIQVSLQEKEDHPRRVDAEVAVQLAMAAPVLPLQEVHYAATHPPRLYLSKVPYSADVLRFEHEPVPANVPISHVVAEHNEGWVRGQGSVLATLYAGDGPDAVEHDANAAYYPSVI